MIRSLNIVSIHICLEKIFLFRKLIAEIESEIKRSLYLGSVLIGQALAVRIVEHFLER